MKGQYRKDDHELRYYGSDLNKFIANKCTKLMTVNNIDCVQYKSSLGYLRIVESKHPGEYSAISQKQLQKVFVNIFSYLQVMRDYDKMGGWSDKLPKNYGVFVVETNILENGELENNTAIIHDLLENVTYTLTEEKFIRWLNFEYDGTS